MEYEIKQDKAILHYIGQKKQRFITICNVNEFFYLMDIDNILTKWNCKTKEIEVFRVIDYVGEIPAEAYVSSVIIGQKIFFLPSREAEMISFDISNESFSKIENSELEEESIDDSWWDKYCCFKLVDGQLHLFSARTKAHYVVDTDKMYKKGEGYLLPVKYYSKLKRQMSLEDCGMENEVISIFSIL